jgi:hypothetical protein
MAGIAAIMINKPSVNTFSLRWQQKHDSRGVAVARVNFHAWGRVAAHSARAIGFALGN